MDKKAYEHGVLFGLGFAQGLVARQVGITSLAAEASRHIHKDLNTLDNEVTPNG